MANRGDLPASKVASEETNRYGCPPCAEEAWKDKEASGGRIESFYPVVSSAVSAGLLECGTYH